MSQPMKQLAADTSPEARGRLLTMVTDAVFKDRQPNAAELALFTDIAGAVLDMLAIEARAEFSEQIADHRAAPHALILRLANDVLIVARPVLARSPVLTHTDLFEMTARLSIGHLLVIAERNDLDTDTADELLRRGDPALMRAVADNCCFRLSREAAEDLVARAETDDELCQHLSARSDLPSAASEHILALVAKRLLGRRPKKAAAPAAPVEEEPEPEAAKPPPGPAFVKERTLAQVMRAVQDKTTTPDEAVVELADGDRHGDVAHLLAHLAGLDEGSVLRVLVRADAHGILSVVRGLDLLPTSWDRIVLLRRRRLKFSETQQRFEREDYLKLSAEEARQTLHKVSGKRGAR